MPPVGGEYILRCHINRGSTLHKSHNLSTGGQADSLLNSTGNLDVGVLFSDEKCSDNFDCPAVFI